MSILVARYGKAFKPWQKCYASLPLHIKYTSKRENIAYRLIVSLRFFKIACGLKGKHRLHKYYK
jgi:hypothetical protein